MQESRKEEERESLESFIPFVKMLVKKYGNPYLRHDHSTLGDLLSYGYEALVRAYNSWDGRTKLKWWIKYKVRRSFSSFVRDTDFATRPHRRLIKQGEEPNIVFIDPEEANLSVNGYRIKCMIDHYYVQHLLSVARLTSREKRRVKKYYFEDFLMSEIAASEKVGVAAISQTINSALEKMRYASKGN